MSTPPNVFLKVKDWKLKRSIIPGTPIYTGYRVFIESSANPSDSTIIPFPDIGASWDSDYYNVTMKTWEQTRLDDNPTCPREWTCYYDSTLVYNWANGSSIPPYVPIQAELSGEYNTVDNPSTGNGQWYWSNNMSYATNIKIPKYVFTETLVLTRYIYGNDLVDFHSKAMYPCLNKVNNYTFLGYQTVSGIVITDPNFWVPPKDGGFQEETVLFTGCTLDEQVSEYMNRKWECKLHFQVRCVPNATGDTDPTKPGAYGWNYIYNTITGNYDKLLMGIDPVNSPKLFDTADFSLLFTVGTPVITSVNLPLPVF